MKESVLVVDDMPIIRDPIAATLAANGYEALCAGDGKQALEMLRAQHVDLVLLDVDMPVMDGLTFLRRLRGNSSTAKMPVIMLSGNEDRRDILEAAKLGIQGYVLKSRFSLKELLARVTQHFAGLTPAAAPIAPQQQVAMSSTCSSAPGPAPSVKGSLPDVTKVAVKPTDEGPPRPVAVRTRGEIPSLIDREECLARAKQALHGRTLSGVASEVISLTASPRSSASDLTAMIARDPLLSARVLQLANSSAYASSRGKVSTLPDAVRNIGSAAVRNIAAALGVFNAMPVSESDGFNQLRCWQHAFGVATLCNHLATERDAALAYLVGLCHDLGEILFRTQFAEEYQQVLEIQEATGKPRDEVTKIVLGMSHGDLVETIMNCLALPRAISAPIQEYHTNGSAKSGGSSVTRLLRVADLYANGMLLASSNQSPIRPLTCSEANAVTGSDNPPPIDRVAMRGEILGLTATLSRFSEKQQTEVMTAPYARRPIRIWLARDASLSSFDPMEAALDLLAEVTPRNVLPDVGEAAEHQAIVVMARSSSAPGFTADELKKAATSPNGKPLPILWLVGRADGDQPGTVPSPWPIPLAKLAEFVAAVTVV